MAEIYLAKDTRTDQVVVIKRILPYLAEEPEFVQMFLDEARIISQLHHPNIVSLLELGRLEGSIFIAMEWVDGADLRKLVAEHGAVLAWRLGAYIVARLCEGLGSAHSRTGSDGGPLGIVHRDISPQNLMISYEGEVKLVDFGIAKATAWVSRSKPGFIKGKFLYLSPEQLTQEPIDSRSDIFAVGSLLYEITTGRSAFHRPSTEAIIYAIRKEQPTPPSSVVPGYPPELARIVLKCLEKDRSKRYQTCEDVQRALDSFLRSNAPTDRADIARLMSLVFGDKHERTILAVPSGVNPSPITATDAGTPLGAGHAPTRQDRVRPNPQNDNAMTAQQLPAVAEKLREAARKGEPIALAEVDTGPTNVDHVARHESEAIAEALAELNASDDEHTAPMSDLGKRPMLAPFSEFERTPSIPSSAPEPHPTAPDPQPPANEDPTGRTPVIVRPSYAQLTAAARDRSAPLNLSLEPVDDHVETADQSAVPEPDDDHVDTVDQRAVSVSDDDLETVNQASAPPDDFVDQTISAPSNARTALVVAIGVVAFLIAAAITFMIWPQLTADPKAKPRVVPSAPVDAGTVVVAPPTPPPVPGAPSLVQVKFQAKKGTRIQVGSVEINPGEQRAMAPGKMQVKFVCPPAKRGKKGKAVTLDFEIPADEVNVQLVDAPCP